MKLKILYFLLWIFVFIFNINFSYWNVIQYSTLNPSLVIPSITSSWGLKAVHSSNSTIWYNLNDINLNLWFYVINRNLNNYIKLINWDYILLSATYSSLSWIYYNDITYYNTLNNTFNVLLSLNTYTSNIWIWLINYNNINYLVFSNWSNNYFLNLSSYIFESLDLSNSWIIITTSIVLNNTEMNNMQIIGSNLFYTDTSWRVSTIYYDFLLEKSNINLNFFNSDFTSVSPYYNLYYDSIDINNNSYNFIYSDSNLWTTYFSYNYNTNEVNIIDSNINNYYIWYYNNKYYYTDINSPYIDNNLYLKKSNKLYFVTLSDGNDYLVYYDIDSYYINTDYNNNWLIVNSNSIFSNSLNYESSSYFDFSILMDFILNINPYLDSTPNLSFVIPLPVWETNWITVNTYNWIIPTISDRLNYNNINSSDYWIFIYFISIIFIIIKFFLILLYFGLIYIFYWLLLKFSNLLFWEKIASSNIGGNLASSIAFGVYYVLYIAFIVVLIGYISVSVVPLLWIVNNYINLFFTFFTVSLNWYELFFTFTSYIFTTFFLLLSSYILYLWILKFWRIN